MPESYTTSDSIALLSLVLSSVIAIIGIIINALIAIWVIHTIQSKVNNERVLKDHLIGEIKEIRNEYTQYLSNLYNDKTPSKRVLPWFKLMNIKVNELLDIVHNKYKIDRNLLKPYQIDLPELITNSDDFINQFDSESCINFSEISKNSLVRFQQNHSHLFNILIININDA